MTTSTTATPSKPGTSSRSSSPPGTAGSFVVDNWQGVAALGVAGAAWWGWDVCGRAWYDSGGSTVLGAVGLGAGLAAGGAMVLRTRGSVGRAGARRLRRTINDGLAGAKVPAKVRWLKLDGSGVLAAVGLEHATDVHLSALQQRKAVEVVTGRAGRGTAFEADYQPDEKMPKLNLRRVRSPEPLPTLVPYPFDRPAHPYRIEYGVAAGGDVQAWDIKGSPHALVVGETGAGKTGAMRALLTGIILRRHRLWIIDPKKLEFRDLDGLPNVRRAGDARGFKSQHQIAAMIDEAHALMEERNDLGKEERERQPLLFLVVDEFFEMVAGLNRLWKAEGNRGEHPGVGKLVEMATLARSAGIHLVFGIQRPDTAVMSKDAGGVLRDQLGHRISVGRMKRGGAVMVWEDAYEAAMAIPATKPDDTPLKGRALATGPKGPREVQVWWVDFDDEAVLGALRPFSHLPPPPSEAPPMPAPAAAGECPDLEAEVAVMAEAERNVLACHLAPDDVLLLWDGDERRACAVVAIEEEGDQIVVHWRAPDGVEGSSTFDELETVVAMA